MAVSSLTQLASCLQEPLTLVNLRAIMLLLVQAHYSDPANFGLFEDELECLASNPEDPKRKLAILLDHVADAKNPSPVPAIWVNYEECRLDKKVINNLSESSEDNSRTTYLKQQQVKFMITHVHSSVDIAITMAESTADFFSGVRPHLMSTLRLGSFEVDYISKPRLMERSPERNFEVDVALTLVFSYATSVNIESHRLKKFSLEIEG